MSELVLGFLAITVATHTLAATMVTLILLTITATVREDITAAIQVTTAATTAMGIFMVMAAITEEEEGLVDEVASVVTAEEIVSWHRESEKHTADRFASPWRPAECREIVSARKIKHLLERD